MNSFNINRKWILGVNAINESSNPPPKDFPKGTLASVNDEEKPVINVNTTNMENLTSTCLKNIIKNVQILVVSKNMEKKASAYLTSNTVKKYYDLINNMTDNTLSLLQNMEDIKTLINRTPSESNVPGSNTSMKNTAIESQIPSSSNIPQSNILLKETASESRSTSIFILLVIIFGLVLYIGYLSCKIRAM